MTPKYIKIVSNEIFPIIFDEVIGSKDGWIEYLSGRRIEHPSIKEVRQGSIVTYLGFSIPDNSLNRFLLRITHDFKSDNQVSIYFSDTDINELICEIRTQKMDKMSK